MNIDMIQRMVIQGIGSIPACDYQIAMPAVAREEVQTNYSPIKPRTCPAQCKLCTDCPDPLDSLGRCTYDIHINQQIKKRFGGV